jgi:peptidoglycan/xylan/chitin deacetylase (PgdA/CDA1 family)
MGLRRKEWVAAALYYSGAVHLLALIRRMLGLGAPIFLTGHRVLPVQAQAAAVDRMALLSGHAITPQTLQRRLGFLQRWVMPAGDPQELRAGLPRRRAFYLTFDDGYRDNVEHAGPVLRRQGVRAVIFFVADLLAHPKASPWWDRWGADALNECANEADALQRYNQRCGQAKGQFHGLQATDLQADGTVARYLGHDELGQLPQEFWLGNHTRAHANLALLSPEERQAHISAGAAALSAHPRYLPLLAFPFGTYDEALVSSVQSAGQHSLAFATGRGKALHPFCITRLNLNLRSEAMFAAQAVGLMR